ncbi:MAG: FMN-binding protein [Desulfamplus sp.]|nr:FMN-binding protein [Desulfamplus sp.]MBF0257416.1 FMN-binding protein [Desulfamplus sp.]
MNFFKNSNLAQAWLVLLLATVFGTALAGIQVKLSPVIEANKTRETMEKIPDLVLDTSMATQTATQDLIIQSRVIEIEKNGITKFYPVYDVQQKNGSLAGHVAKARGQGYADKIEVLIGLDAGGNTITGLFILDQKETPGLGNKIVEKTWRDQFINKLSDTPLIVVKSKTGQPNEIDGISGATISSRSVTGIVNTTIADIRPRLLPIPKTEETE